MRTHRTVANVWWHRSDTVDLLTPSHYPIRALSSSVTDSVWNCHSSEASGGCLPSLLLQGRCDWAIAAIGGVDYLTGSWLQMKAGCLGRWLTGQRKEVEGFDMSSVIKSFSYCWKYTVTVLSCLILFTLGWSLLFRYSGSNYGHRYWLLIALK